VKGYSLLGITMKLRPPN